jgi:hypothetical protein
VGAVGQENQLGGATFSARRIVEVLAGLVRSGEPRGGAEAVQVAEEMQAAVMAQLEGNLGHVVLWEQFLRTPDDVSDAVVGVIQALIRRDPVFEDWLHEAWGRWQRATQGAER